MNEVEFRRARGLFSLPGAETISSANIDGNAGEGQISLLAYLLSMLRRRKWMILGAVALALAAGLLLTLLMTPRYTAASTVEIRRETGNLIGVEGAEAQTGLMDQEFYETQYGLLQSRSLAERVATDLRLADNADFFELFGEQDATEWFENGRLIPNASTRDERVRLAGEVLLEHFEATPARLSRLVYLRFTSPDPSLSQRVANAWAANFIQETLERRFDATSHAREFLEERLAQLRARIEESERALVNYASRQQIVNVPSSEDSGLSSAADRPLIAQDLASLNRELGEAVADRVRAQSRLQAGRGNVSEALENPTITSLRETRAERSAEYARMMVQFEPGYPPARALQQQIEQLDRAIAREETRVQNTLEETYNASLAREQNLRQRVDQLKAGVLDLRRRSIQYNILERDADTNRQLYDALLQRYKEIGVAGGVGVNNISVVDEADVPLEPSSPNLPLNMVLSLLAGLILGVGSALALEQIDQGISDPSEVGSELGMPLLGTIPKVPGDRTVEDLSDPKSALSEAYLSLQTGLAFSTDHGVPKTLAITSSRPAEGKTTTSYALARTIARSGWRVLLIDSDMRSPSMHHQFGVDNERGLSNYLSGNSEVATAIRSTDQANLFLMTAGPQPPNAAELLSSSRFSNMLVELQGEFDHVLIDAPPVLGLADAPLIANAAEAIAFVIEARGTQRGMAQVALQRLQGANALILGVVLTKFDSKRAHFGYGYDYGYGYGYGDSEKKPD